MARSFNFTHSITYKDEVVYNLNHRTKEAAAEAANLVVAIMVREWADTPTPRLREDFKLDNRAMKSSPSRVKTKPSK